MNDVGNMLEPKYERRLSDLITAAFYEACRAGNLDAAEQLVVALEYEVTRSIRLVGADRREDGDDVAAVHAKLQRELTRLHVIQTSADAAGADRLLDLDAPAHDEPLISTDLLPTLRPGAARVVRRREREPGASSRGGCWSTLNVTTLDLEPAGGPAMEARDETASGSRRRLPS